ncbi:MAG: hypothetical protein FWD83_10095, partial [Promicromonosporaceae bacterium]|nr:hypothetical protein [Promicromonosporaceae bacterium]
MTTTPVLEQPETDALDEFNFFDDELSALPDDLRPLRGANIAKFAIFSVIGLALFLTPIPDGEGAFNIPLGVAITWVESSIFAAGGLNIGTWILLAVVTASALGSVLLMVAGYKPRNEWLARAFKTGPVFVVSRVLGAVAAWMIFTQWGPDFVTAGDTGGVIMGISTHLIAVFVFLGMAIPLLTDFGIMEFVGSLISRAVRRLFTLPGRASVDLAASWFGSSVASVLLTRNQHEKNHYTGREAVVICTNFAFVSLPFSLFVVNFIGIQAHFLPLYLLICAVCIILGVITPRIWPLRSLDDTYLDGGKGEIAEELVPMGYRRSTWGLRLAADRASRTRFRDVAASGAKMTLDIYLDLIPLIVGWGVLALAIFEFTDIFQWISTP